MPKKKKHTLLDKLSERFHILLVNEKTLARANKGSTRRVFKKLSSANKLTSKGLKIMSNIKIPKPLNTERSNIC